MWSDTEDVSRVGQSLVGIPINNSTTVIDNTGKRGEVGKILEDLRLAPYDN